HSQRILVVDSVGAIAGGIGGVSSNTSFVESTSGVAEGARTGLSAIVVGIAFLLAAFLSPLVALVPYEAATPALVMVGFLMMTQITDIDFTDVEVALPAFLTIILMPFAYSITVGMGAGFIMYVLIRVVRGKARQVHWLMYLISIMYIIYFLLGGIEGLLLGPGRSAGRTRSRTPPNWRPSSAVCHGSPPASFAPTPPQTRPRRRSTRCWPIFNVPGSRHRGRTPLSST